MNAIITEVIGNALGSVAEEMGEALVRASHSPNIKERRDCSTAILTPTGEIVCQSENVPMHLGSFLSIASKITERFPLGAIAPSDVFMCNDPYAGGGTHLPDLALVRAVYFEGEHVGWVANCAHHADFADRGHAHIFQEGVRIPPVRLVVGGEVQREVRDLFLLNCQVPHERLLDLQAQLASVELGAKRLESLCRRYGAANIASTAAALANAAERQIRAGIAAIPNGTYSFTDSFDALDLEGELSLALTLTVADDQISLNFEAPSQVRGRTNMTRDALLAAVYYAVKTLVAPNGTLNSGVFRPFSVEAPVGSVLNCVAPAAVDGRMDIGQRVVDLIIGALAPAIPDRVIAACSGAGCGIQFSGMKDGKPWVYFEAIAGGFGARASKDGLSGVQVHLSNTSNLPVEALESEYPVTVTSYELEKNSGGAGRWRGGMGLRRGYLVLEACRVEVIGVRIGKGPWGIAGGLAGGRFAVQLPANAAEHGRNHALLAPGDRLEIVTPGSGGYGPPASRDRDAVLQDLIELRIDSPTASDIYGLPADLHPAEAVSWGSR